MYRILIVEDDAAIATAIAEQLKHWGLAAKGVEDFQNVMGEVKAYDPQLILLDIGLPFFNGYYWCTEIRKVSKVPILFLSSAADNLNIVMAMNLGADDFIAKPFDFGVLIAKIQAMLRRTYDFTLAAPLLSHRGAQLNPADQTLQYAGNSIALTKNEYRILFALLEQKGKIVSREKLMERLWETDSFVDENTLTVNINRLRKKLDAAGLPDFIKTKIGVGYSIA